MDRLPFALFLGSLIFAPLAFGAVHTYAYSFTFLSIQLGVLLLLVGRVRKPAGDKGSFIILSPVHLCFAVLFSYLLFQMLPFPPWMTRLISPFSHVCAEKAVPASQAITDPGVKDWISIAPYGFPVRMSLIRLTGYWLLFFGLLHTVHSRKRLHILILVLIGSGLFQAFYGFIQAYGRGYHIWWFEVIGVKGAITGTFINKNNFAGYMMMTTLLAIGYAAASGPKRRITGRWIGRISESLEENSRRFLIIFLAAVMFIALIFSRSRGGITSFLIAICLLWILFLLKKGRKAAGGLLLVLMGITSVYAIQIGLDPVIDRFRHTDITENARTRFSQKTLDMFRDYPILGVGVGDFQYAYPRYQASEDKKGFIQYAHNDWAQFLAEGGISGMVLLLAALGFFLYRYFTVMATRSDPFSVFLGLGPVAALSSILLHSFVDFDLHIPANPLTLSAILAAGYVAIHLERRRPRDRFLYHYLKKDRIKGYSLFLLFISVVTVWTGWWSIRHFMAEAYCNTVHNSTLNRDQNPPLSKITKAIRWDGGNASYCYKLARERIRIRDGEKGVWIQDAGSSIQGRKRIQRDIITALEEAVLLNPFKADHHHQLGWEYTYMWNVEPEAHKKWLTAADISMDRAAFFAGDINPYLHLLMGNYWVMRSKTVRPVSPEWWNALARAGWHYKKNLSLESGPDRERMAKEIRRNIWLHYPDEAFVKEILQ